MVCCDVMSAMGCRGAVGGGDASRRPRLGTTRCPPRWRPAQVCILSLWWVPWRAAKCASTQLARARAHTPDLRQPPMASPQLMAASPWPTASPQHMASLRLMA